MPKTQTKFSINDDKLKNFCRDLLKMKETKTDKVSAHSGFISSTVQIEKEKPPLIPTKQAKSISSNFKTKIKSSDEFMNQEEKEIGRLHQKENTNMMKNQVNIMITDKINLEIMKTSINLGI